MTTAIPIRCVLLAALLTTLVSTTPTSAQVRYKIPDPVIEREWEADAAGLWQWKAYDVKCPVCRGKKDPVCEGCKDSDKKVCMECDGKKTAPCRVCLGSTKLPDPLEELTCIYCIGSGWYPCGLCKGRGSYPVQGGGSGEQKCGACKGNGSIRCQACKGKQRLPVVKVGRKGPAEASLEDLQDVRKILEEGLEAVKAFEPVGNESKGQKAFAQAIDKLGKILPATRGAKAMLSEVLKGLRKGASYVGYDEWVRNQFVVFQDFTVYLLRHQILLVDLCAKRAEHNEKVQADKKDRP